MKHNSGSLNYFFGAILFIFLLTLGFSFYLEYGQGLQPCPLCLFQRFINLLLCCIAFIAFVHRGQKLAKVIYALLVGLIALAGMALALRQVWLQHLPPGETPGCGASLSFMYEHMPFDRFFMAVLKGTGDCAEVKWQLINVSLPEWSAIFFGLISVTTLIYGLKQALK
jgi:disulfide bond formation protein DsbB